LVKKGRGDGMRGREQKGEGPKVDRKEEAILFRVEKTKPTQTGDGGLQKRRLRSRKPSSKAVG